MDAQKAQIRTASVAIGIEPKSARNGGSRVLMFLCSVAERGCWRLAGLPRVYFS
jgi:hypothetical protein